MQELFTRPHLVDVMRLPPAREFRAALPQPAQQVEEGRIAGSEVVRGAELRHHAPRLRGPAIPEQAPGARLGQHADQGVPVLRRQSV